MSHAPAPKGHNLPPITPPTEQEMLDDLNARFPELEVRLAEFTAALKEYPTEFSLADEDRAAALQDLLGQIRKQKSIIAAHKKTEKAPWDRLVKVVQNLFTKADEKLDALIEEWGPRHQAYMDLRKAENLRKQEAEAEKQRAAEEANRKAAAEAEERRLAAEKAEAEAREREENARRAAEQAQKEEAEARERAAAAAAEEKRLAEEKKAKDRAEKDRNEESLRAIKRHMKDAARLHDKMGEAEEGDIDQDDIDQLDALVRTGGIIGVLAGPVFGSHLLSREQVLEIEQTRATLGNMRQVLSERLDAKVRRKRAREAAEQEKRDAAAAAERKRLREEDEARQIAAAAARRTAEEQAQKAKTSAEAAKGEIREARTEARGAQQEQKAAGRVEKQATADADRAGNRADRIEDRLENATDAEIAGTLRGDLGTKGSLTRRWTLRIMDDEALRAVLGPLGPHFTEDALNGAAYRWMLAHQAGWSGRERVEGELAGVVFAYQQGARIS